MKSLFLLTGLFFFSCVGRSQTVIQFFRQLPDDKVLGLTLEQRDELLVKGKLYDPDNTSEEVSYYEYRYSICPEKNEHLLFEMEFEKGPSGFVLFEFTRFEDASGNTLFGFSRNGGTPKAPHHHEHAFYLFRNGKYELSQLQFPEPNYKLFVSPNQKEKIKMPPYQKPFPILKMKNDNSISWKVTNSFFMRDDPIYIGDLAITTFQNGSFSKYKILWYDDIPESSDDDCLVIESDFFNKYNEYLINRNQLPE